MGGVGRRRGKRGPGQPSMGDGDDDCDVYAYRLLLSSFVCVIFKFQFRGTNGLPPLFLMKPTPEL